MSMHHSLQCINVVKSKLLFRFYHHSHAQRYHIYVDLLVSHQIHLQKVVRFGLPELCLVDSVEFLEKDEF